MGGESNTAENLPKRLPERGCEDVRDVVSCIHTLRGNNTSFSELSRVMASNLDVLVGLVINRIENHGNNTRVVDIDRHWSGGNLRLELLEQNNQPLSLLGAKRESQVLGMVRARRNIGG
jgi:hypothetical protein